MKKMIKHFSALLLLLFVMVFVASCTNKPKTVTLETVKIGLITLHDETSTYDKNFIDSLKSAAKDLGLKESQYEIVSNVGENNDCYEAAARLAKDCDIVFADSFGHETYMIQAAREFKNVYFAHATGTMAHTVKLNNYANGFASIYEGRYLAGVAAGMKLNEMIAAGTITEAEAKMGYVGAFPYAEVKSGYTSFYLGAKSVCPSVTMEVKFTNSWYDLEREETVANYLIKTKKCVLISQHADSMGAPNACEKAGVPNVTYNGSTNAACPETYIVSSKIDWAPYFKYLINQRVKGEKLAYDWVGTLSNGAVKLDAVGKNAANGTQAKIEEVKAKLEAGTLHVFDTNNFTVDGKKVTTYLADVDSDEKYTGDTEVIKDGYFHESEFRSAPYFDLSIDGITNLGSDYKDK